jgi:group I intron endonuclease
VYNNISQSMHVCVIKRMVKEVGIYAIINNKNLNIYIGSSNNLKHRKNQHFSLLRNNNHFNKKLQNSWNKYGEENFTFEIIEKCEERDLMVKESFWMQFYGSYKKKNGYNLDTIKGRKIISEETKRKISLNHAKYWEGKDFSEQHKKRLSENNAKPMKGKIFSQEHRKKISEKNKKAIVQIDKNGNIINEFLGIQEAATKTGFSEIGIQQVLTQYKRKTIYGFIFKYKD